MFCLQQIQTKGGSSSTLLSRNPGTLTWQSASQYLDMAWTSWGIHPIKGAVTNGLRPHLAVQTLPSSSCTIQCRSHCSWLRLHFIDSHPPPASQSSNPSVSSPMSAPLSQSMLQMCAVHYVYMRICCVCQRRVGGRLNAGVSGVNPISGPNVAMYRIQIAILPCTIVQNPDSRCLEHLSFPSPSMPSFINHLYCTRG